MTSTQTAGVTTTQTTLARVAEAAVLKGSTIPDLLLHEYVLSMRAEARAKKSKDALAAAIKEYMTSEAVNEVESDEAKAIRFDVANQGKFDTAGLERDHPAVFQRYYTPSDGVHSAFKVTPRA
jgi:hypothetical protein